MVSRPYERPRLNERPIYLRSFFFTLAVMQSMYHLYYDYDKVALPVAKSKSDTVADQQPPVIVSPLTRVRAALFQLSQTVLQRSLPMIVVGPITYSLLIRRTAWSWTLFFAKLLWKLPKSAEPPRIPPYHISLLLRSVSSSFLLIILWEASNAIFSAYVAQNPLKRGQPLTNDSRDPNGSLLSGLKSRKEAPKVGSGGYHWLESRLTINRHLRSGSFPISASAPKSAENPSSLRLIVQAGRRGHKR